MTESYLQALKWAEASVASCNPADAMVPWFRLLLTILKERNLTECEFWKSHFAVYIVPGKSVPDEIASPRLEVRHTDKGILLELGYTTDKSPMYRRTRESALCAPDQAIGEFDRLLASFVELLPLDFRTPMSRKKQGRLQLRPSGVSGTRAEVEAAFAAAITACTCPACGSEFTDAAVEWGFAWYEGYADRIREEGRDLRDGSFKLKCEICSRRSTYCVFGSTVTLLPEQHDGRGA